MANEFTAAPIELASGIGENNVTAPLLPQEDLYNQAFDPAAFEAEKQRKQGNEVQSLLNAASPTPLGKPITPSVAETLSTLGKVEPAQVGAASIALDGAQVPQAPQPVGPYAINPTAQVSATPPVTDINPLSGIAGSMDAAFVQQQQAARDVAKATEAKAVADQTQFKNAEAGYAKAEVERAETKMKFDADFKGKMQSYEQSVEEYKQAAGEKVIPGRLLADMSTGQRIQTGIFMALSAYGSAMSGQENQALKVINNAIDKDIDAQKFNLENKLKGARIGIEGSQYLMAQMRNKFGDDITATLASKDAMLAMTQQKLHMNSSKFDQATAGPKAQAMISQIEMQRQQLKMQMEQQQAQNYMLKQVQGRGKHVLSDAELTVMESVQKGYRERHVPGFGQATDGEQKKKFVEYYSEINPAIEGLGRIQTLAKDFNKITDLTKRAQIQTELAAVLGALRIPITGPGILTESERQSILKDVIGNPNAIVTLPSLMRAKLQTTMNKLSTDLAARGKIAGLPDDSFQKPTSKKFFLD